MKKFFTFLLPFSLLASAALSSCSDGCTGDPDPTPELPDGYTYATENTSINDGNQGHALRQIRNHQSHGKS